MLIIKRKVDRICGTLFKYYTYNASVSLCWHNTFNFCRCRQCCISYTTEIHLITCIKEPPVFQLSERPRVLYIWYQRQSIYASLYYLILVNCTKNWISEIALINWHLRAALTAIFVWFEGTDFFFFDCIEIICLVNDKLPFHSISYGRQGNTFSTVSSKGLLMRTQ